MSKKINLKPKSNNPPIITPSENIGAGRKTLPPTNLKPPTPKI